MMPIDAAPVHVTPERVNTLAANYAAHFSGLERWLVANRPRICPFARLMEAVPAASRVFDIGCGTGLFLYLLAGERKIGHGIGVDIARGEIAAGQVALKALDVSNLELQCVSSINGWPTEEFDVVTLIDVLHHCPPAEQERFFAEACARVRKGGILIYKDMCQFPFWKAWANRLHDLVKARQWIHYVPIERAEEWALSRGFEVLARGRIDMYVYGHELRIFERRQ
jgi:SAM-dependent methyltransferase